RGLGHRPFTAVTGVRIPVGTPSIFLSFHIFIFQRLKLLKSYTFKAQLMQIILITIDYGNQVNDNRFHYLSKI
uniref:hypothetical protein n=1 Tax=Acinetobacter pseudolwoffii TaxID=2053287 RepID=UPI003988C39C